MNIEEKAIQARLEVTLSIDEYKLLIETLELSEIFFPTKQERLKHLNVIIQNYTSLKMR